ncbi:MAG TPA: hypothetical protein VGL53_23415 [Bryobacteraceae bacterium]|jgi:hypothetical protein
MPMIKQIRYRLIVTAFFATLWMLFFGTWLEWGQFNRADEYRILAPFPEWNKRLPLTLSAYLADHFGFRGSLITVNGLLRAKLLHTSTSPKVVFGKQGFLFYAGDQSMESYNGSRAITDCDIDSWVLLLERRQAWLATKGIPLIVLLAPDKQTVYPELMPDGIHHATPTSADRWVAAIRRTHVPLIDMRPIEIAGKERRRVFHKTDTHWDPWGAYLAYRELLNEVARISPPLAEKIGPPADPMTLKIDFKILNGDMNRLLGLSILPGERAQDFLPPHPIPIRADDAVIDGGTGNPKQPRMLMFRDSFASAMAPFLAPHFDHIFGTAIPSFDVDLVKKEHPDLVVVELVERHLNFAVPIDPDNTLNVSDPKAVFPGLWGVIDEPFNGEVLHGPKIRSSGWALANDDNSIEKIQFMLDGHSVADMRIHLPHAGVAKAQPGQKDSANAGVQYDWDSRSVPNGMHRLVWKATDSAGRTAEIGHRQFCVAN